MIQIISVINDYDEPADACKIIINCLKRKTELAGYIIKKANGEKIDSQKMATIPNVMSDSDSSKWDQLLEGGLFNISQNLSNRLKLELSKNFNKIIYSNLKQKQLKMILSKSSTKLLRFLKFNSKITYFRLQKLVRCTLLMQINMWLHFLLQEMAKL